MGKNDIFLKGTYIYLKALSEDDVLNSNWYGWFNDEETTRYLQKHYFPNTRNAQLDFCKKEVADKLQLGICDINGRPIVGVVSLNHIDHLNQKAELSLVVGEKEYRKPCYIIEVFQLVLSHAFNALNLQKIYAGSLSNELVEFYCRTLGFSREGILRKDIYKNGKYCDVYLYAIFKDEYDLIISKLCKGN